MIYCFSTALSPGVDGDPHSPPVIGARRRSSTIAFLGIAEDKVCYYNCYAVMKFLSRLLHLQELMIELG